MSLITPELCSTNLMLASQLGAGQGHLVNYQLLNEAEYHLKNYEGPDLHNSSDDMKAE